MTPICISLGPGDAGLVTVKALKALNEADIIFCPVTRRDDKEVSRAKDILDELGISESKIRLFGVPMMKNRTEAEAAYQATAEEIARLHDNGIQVAFVAEGDSGFYSSVHYISDILSAKGIAVRHIAGVPAFIACGALAGIHIVKQNEPLVVFPSNVSVEEITSQIATDKSVVLMKLSQQEESVKQAIHLMPEAQFHYFENVGVTEKEFYTQNTTEIMERDFPYFSILIIRKN